MWNEVCEMFDKRTTRFFVVANTFLYSATLCIRKIIFPEENCIKKSIKKRTS